MQSDLAPFAVSQTHFKKERIIDVDVKYLFQISESLTLVVNWFTAICDNNRLL